MKFGFGKRIAGFVLAAAVAAGTFLSTPVTAKAAAPLAKGIDVSKYQGAVNWSAVKNAGYSFAFIKAGSAKSGLDPYYAVNMAGATAAGMKVGVYVYSYATTVEGAMTEAQFAIAAMEPYSVSYPVVYDLEDSIHKNMSPDQLAALTVAFCRLTPISARPSSTDRGSRLLRDALLLEGLFGQLSLPGSADRL